MDESSCVVTAECGPYMVSRGSR